MKVGDEASLTRLLTEDDIRAFARITGDDNPLHLDTEYARETRFRKPVAHGFLVASLISAVLGTRLPGPGSVYLSQSLSFLAPVYPGDTITASVRIVEMDNDKGIVSLHTEVTNQSRIRVVSGEARLLSVGVMG